MFKLGRKKRTFNPKIAHMSAILGARKAIIPPPSVDWTHGINNFGIMLNDNLGDCTCAGIYHAIQIWSANTLIEQTEPDNVVLSLYEQACGYKPGDESTDNGGVEQDLLSYCVNTGVPLSNGQREKFLCFIEVDPRNINDVKTTIDEFGLAYIGIDVPNSLYDQNGDPKLVWDVDPNDTSTEGGHCIILVGYDADGATVISWGQKYKMTWAFFRQFTDEVYAIVSQNWINSQGKTPLGLTVEELDNIAATIKE